MRVATFRCDITPGPGEPLVWATPLTKVEEPLLGKGIVLEDGTNRFILCALDWCLVCNETELSFRRALASAAGTDPARVAVQCLHQHAAPYADEAAYRLLEAAPKPLPHLSAGFMDKVRRQLADAVQEATARLEPFDRIGMGQAKAERIASARRLRDNDGRPLTRFSSGARNPSMAEAPEGPIDPFLKTITLASGHKPLVRLHYYATHPQTFCCDGRASADFVGLAREAVERDDKTFQIYFTGCAGDVTVGKYNDGSPQAQAGLTQRLEAAMLASIAQTHYVPAKHLVWRTQTVVLPLRGSRADVTAASRAWLNDPAQPDGHRVYEGVMRLAFVERLDRPIQVSSLQIGRAYILHLPGEPMLAFQFFAQQARPDDFIAVAGYGDCGCAYICTDQAIAEGGYEPTASNVGKGSEAALKQAIRALLGQPGAP
ncbi:MAG TPA: hypothetical protein VMU04_13285 [Candidatus Acidoferrum sp.]|nr:hypothetical protein [Candidatus Acidoferrum sp.]